MIIQKQNFNTLSTQISSTRKTRFVNRRYWTAVRKILLSCELRRTSTYVLQIFCSTSSQYLLYLLTQIRKKNLLYNCITLSVLMLTRLLYTEKYRKLREYFLLRDPQRDTILLLHTFVLQDIFMNFIRHRLCDIEKIKKLTFLL